MFERTRRAGNWLLNLNNYGSGIYNNITRPMEWLGFQVYGEGQDNAGLTYGGYRVRSRDPALNSTGRWWIPDYTDGKTDSHIGTWGTREELKAAARNYGDTGSGRFSKFYRRNKMMYGRYVQPAISAGFFLLDFKSNLAQGKGVMSSLGSTIVSSAKLALGQRLLLPLMANPVGLGLTIAATLGVGYLNYRNNAAEYSKKVKKTEFIGDMSAFQTNQAATMRQRSVQAIQRSFLNARTALGNEARFNHMPYSIGANNPANYY